MKEFEKISNKEALELHKRAERYTPDDVIDKVLKSLPLDFRSNKLLFGTVIFRELKMKGNYTSTIILTISDCKDEWYLLKNSGVVDEFYKCDQLDGLINCISYLLRNSTHNISPSLSPK